MQFASSPRPSARPARNRKVTPPVFLATARCPACGREPAIVFQVVRSADGRPPQPRPVCLACCPKAAGDA
jgi:hypothetical protein